VTEPRSTDVDEPLDYAERWLRDGLEVLRPALMVHQISVDATGAMDRLSDLRRGGVHATLTHLIVHAAARALAANPELHQLIAGYRRYKPARVDIGLAVTAEKFLGSPLVIEGADQKTVPELVAEIARRVPEVQTADRQLFRMLNVWGRLIPFGFLRRAILRMLFSRPAFRRKGAGTFQVSTVPVDWAFGSSFTASGLLVGGRVWSRVIAMDGQPVVRPIMTLTLSGDHGVWHGQATARFLAAVKQQLEKPSTS
jgi:pyruvate/2-oxoglutarate dehydrogenase complex dihydrolipoamide acyltransferase (E2) component